MTSVHVRSAGQGASESLEQGFIGCLLAAAIGDALGAPVEFDSLETIAARFGRDGITDLIPDSTGVAHYTDDTQMLEAVARGLLDAGDEADDLDATMRAIAVHFIRWAREPQGGHRAPGNVCLAGCRRLAAGTDWREAGDPSAGGCGSVMRVAPFGLRWYREPHKAAEWGAAHSLLTHGDPIARAASAAMATGVALAIQHTPRLDLLDQMARAAEGHSRTTAAMIRTAVAEAHDGTAPGVTLDRLRGWAAHEAIAAAAYVFARHPRDVRQALIEAANTPGDSDSIACMTGALVGAYNGAEAIDADWTEHLERAQELRYLALDLLERT